MEAIIISAIGLVFAIAALLVALKCREEVRELRKSSDNYFQVEDGVIYTKPQYKGLASRGFLSADGIRKNNS